MENVQRRAQPKRILRRLLRIVLHIYRGFPSFEECFEVVHLKVLYNSTNLVKVLGVDEKFGRNSSVKLMSLDYMRFYLLSGNQNQTNFKLFCERMYIFDTKLGHALGHCL